jgi:hypothetical protein
LNADEKDEKDLRRSDFVSDGLDYFFGVAGGCVESGTGQG